MGGMGRGSGPSARYADVVGLRGALSHAAPSVVPAPRGAVLQPHGALLVADPALVVVQATETAAALLDVPPNGVVGRPLATLAPDLARQAALAAREALLVRPTHLPCAVRTPRPLDVCVHRGAAGELLIELEPAGDDAGTDGAALARLVTAAVASVRAASTMAALHEAAVRQFRLIAGYDRVTLFRMTPDARGIATAVAGEPEPPSANGIRRRRAAPRLSAGAADRLTRRRVCVVVDAQAPAIGLVPRDDTTAVPDLAIAHLRAPDRVQRRLLERGGARAGLFAPLVHADRIWGLVVGEHRTARGCSPAVRLACELLAEVVATRVAALETGPHARAAAHVRLLQRRLADATAATADWRPALLRDAPLLLRLVRADGLALVSGGAVQSAGHLPDDATLQALGAWVARQPHGPLWACRTLDDAPLPGAATGGLLSAAVSPYDGEYLLWYRGARRTGRCPAWTAADRSAAVAVRDAIAHIAAQVGAVGMLVAEQQAMLARDRVASLDAALVVADASGDIILTNDAFARLVGRPHRSARRLHDLAALFADPERARDRLRTLTIARESWRDELAMRGRGRRAVPVAVRADVVAGGRDLVLGYVLTFADLSDQQVADEAQQRLRGALHGGADAPLLDAVRANARDAADEMAGDVTAGTESLLGEVERSLRRATDLGEQILSHARPGRSAGD